MKNKGFSKIMNIVNKLIYEDIKAEALRELIKNATNEANAYKNRRNLSIIETLFRACIRNIPKEETEIYNALSNLIYTEEEEKISKLVFNELQLNNPKNINIKNIITKFAEICANKYKLNKNRVIELFNEIDIDFNKLNFITDSSKKTLDLKNILNYIDASNITDDDIKTFTPETFKEYNKKMRSQFNYAIFMNNGHIKFVGTFDDFGKILNIYSLPILLSKNITLLEALKKSDKILAISSKYLKNIKHKEHYKELSNDTLRRENQLRYEKEKLKNKAINLKNKINDFINKIKNDLKNEFQPVIKSIDIFSDDILSDLYITFKKKLNDIQKDINYERYLENFNLETEKKLLDKVQELKKSYNNLLQELKKY